MVMIYLYLAANIAALVLLWSLKYQRAWPIFTGFQAATCLQIAARWVFDARTKHLNQVLWDAGVWGPQRELLLALWQRSEMVRYWIPCEIICLLTAALTAFEVIWSPMRGVPKRYKWGFCLTLAGGFGLLGHWTRYALEMPKHSDWAFEFITTDRIVTQLCIATIAVIGVGILHTFNRLMPGAPARLHAMVFGGLCSAHIYFGDFSTWQYSHQAYRVAEVLALATWIFNAAWFRRIRRRGTSMLPLKLRFVFRDLHPSAACPPGHSRNDSGAAQFSPSDLPSFRLRAQAPSEALPMHARKFHPQR